MEHAGIVDEPVVDDPGEIDPADAFKFHFTNWEVSRAKKNLKIRAYSEFDRHLKNVWLMLVTINPEKRQQDSKVCCRMCVASDPTYVR